MSFLKSKTEISSLSSLDTPEAGDHQKISNGDHENYYVQHDLTQYSILYKNGSLVDAVCEAKAVRIRDISKHRLWPNIFNTTLVFSSKRDSNNDTFHKENELSEKGDIDKFSDNKIQFFKGVKPNYG